MNVALIPMSAKPYHLGHHKLIQLAERSHDAVLVFVSYSGRGTRKIKDPTDNRTIKQGARKIEVPKAGEIPIFGEDMQYIWENILFDELEFSRNVMFFTVASGAHPSPIRNIHEVCEAMLQEGVVDVPFLDQSVDVEDMTVSIYSDLNDIRDNYDMTNMTQMYGGLMSRQISLVGVSRSDTVDISGTKMRELLRTGQLQEFKAFLPPVTKKSKNIVTKILSDSISLGCSFNCREQQKNIMNARDGLPITLG